MHDDVQRAECRGYIVGPSREAHRITEAVGGGEFAQFVHRELAACGFINLVADDVCAHAGGAAHPRQRA